jgi:hypothetical protein
MIDAAILDGDIPQKVQYLWGAPAVLVGAAERLPVDSFTAETIRCDRAEGRSGSVSGEFVFTPSRSLTLGERFRIRPTWRLVA